MAKSKIVEAKKSQKLLQKPIPKLNKELSVDMQKSKKGS